MSAEHDRLCTLIMGGVDPYDALIQCGYSDRYARGTAPHIVGYLTKNGYFARLFPSEKPRRAQAPAEPAGQSAPVVTVAEVKVTPATTTTDTAPAKPKGRPTKGNSS